MSILRKKSSNKQVRSTNMEDGDQKSCATKTYLLDKKSKSNNKKKKHPN
jgi:hypothetical protein